MRFAALPLIASFALLAAPAFAHGPGMAGNYGSTGYSGPQGNQYANPQFSNNQRLGTNQFGDNQFGNNQFGNENDQRVSVNTEQRIRQALEQNGFRNVRVAPQAFVIHARAPDGSHVVMQIGPDVIAGVVASTPATSNNRMGMAQGPRQQQQNQGMGYGR